MGFLGLLGAGIAGSVSGSMAGNAMAGKDPTLRAQQYNATYVNSTIAQMNQMLNETRDAAMKGSEVWTNKAVDTQKDYLGFSVDALNKYLQQATSQAGDAAKEWYNKSQTLLAPYQEQGNIALDKLMTGMGNTDLAPFFNSQEYQLRYGNNTSLDPNQRFLNDAGTQQAIKNGQKVLENSFQAKGLGGSGALAKALTDYSYNNYNDYLDKQSALYGDYRNNRQQQLAGIAQLGQQASLQGSQNANAVGNNLSQLFGNANIATGQNVANANIGAGENIATLYGNQGMFNGSAILNTGAATANNLFNGMTFLAQLNANAAAGNAGTANSAMQGQGAMAGANQLRGIF